MRSTAAAVLSPDRHGGAGKSFAFAGSRFVFSAEIYMRERSLDSEADVLEGFGESTPVNPVR
jgi:hypothetical protein